MPSNSKRTTKTKRKRSRKSTVDKKIKKHRKKKSANEKLNDAINATESIEQNKTDGVEVTTSVVPVELVSREELEKMTRENSFILNPILANASIQKDLEIASMRTRDLSKLHDYLFDSANQAYFDEKTLVNLYSIGVKDHLSQIGIKLKLAEMSDKARMIRETYKYFVEQEKQKEIAAEDMSHTSEIIQALLSESMHKALDDEINKKWGGSNSYRPAENKDFEIISIDPDSENN